MEISLFLRLLPRRDKKIWNYFLDRICIEYSTRFY